MRARENEMMIADAICQRILASTLPKADFVAFEQTIKQINKSITAH